MNVTHLERFGRVCLATIATSGFLASAALGAPSPRNPNDAALDRLVAVSNAICTSPGDYGYSVGGNAGVGFKATMPKLLAKLFAFGLSGSFVGGAEAHKGIAQKDVGSSAGARNACASKVFVHLVDRFSFTDLATGSAVKRPASPVATYVARAPSAGNSASFGSISAPGNSGFIGFNQGPVTINNNAGQPAFDNKDRIIAISMLVKEANSIANKFAASNDTALIREQYHDWYNRADAYLISQFDPSYSAQFEAASGDALMLVGRNIDGSATWSAINGKNKVLTQMLSELRH